MHFAEHAEEADDDGEAGHDEETDGDLPDETEHDEAGPGTFLILFCNFIFKYVTNLQMTSLKMIYCTYYNLGSSELCHVWPTQQLDGKSFSTILSIFI